MVMSSCILDDSLYSKVDMSVNKQDFIREKARQNKSDWRTRKS